VFSLRENVPQTNPRNKNGKKAIIDSFTKEF